MSGWDFNLAVRGFYSNVWGSYINVYKYMYDENSTLTNTFAKAYTIVYNIQVMRSIPSASTNIISVSKSTTNSTIKVTLPKDYQRSVLPMKGAFRIKCVMPDGNFNTTVDIW